MQAHTAAQDVKLKTMSTAPLTNRYRYDLDGLRGIAIGFVVLFHVFVGRVSGGVDVFLLLSGYFFLGSQLRYASRPNASLNPWWPIWRTARRLLPAMVTVLGVLVLIAVFFIPSLQRPEIIDQLIASLLYYQNWELLAQEAAYDVASSETSPLQHLWSMSVQGQFYIFGILFAIVLAFFFRKSPAHLASVAGPILVAITIASFIYAVGLQGANQPLNYYSSFSRAWELTLGGVLAIYAPLIRFPGLLREIATAVGLFMVLTTGIFFDGAVAFPGPAALFPIGGAVLIILGGTDTNRVSSFLSTKAMRWLGEVAYPLYLWHWPLLIIATIIVGQEQPSVGVGIIVVALSLVLADLTHRFIEEPLRQRRKRPLRGDAPAKVAINELKTSRPAQLRAVGGGVIAVALVGMFSVIPAQNAQISAAAEPLDPQLYPGYAAFHGAEVPAVEHQPDPELISAVYPPVGADACMAFSADPADKFVTHAHDDPDNDPCVYGDPNSETEIYLIGGSHAEQWSAPLDIIGKEQGIKIVPLLRQGCPFYLEMPAGDSGDETCLEWNHNAFDILVESDPDLVISTTTRPINEETGEGPDVVPLHYAHAWTALHAQEIPFLGLRDNPWGFSPAGDQRMNRTICMANEENPELCGAERSRVYAPVDPAAEILNPQPGMQAVDTADWFCTPEFCPPVIGNIYVYRDNDHLSTAYMETLVEPLAAEVAAMFETLAAEQRR